MNVAQLKKLIATPSMLERKEFGPSLAAVRYAAEDVAAVDAIESMFRDHLLAALSEARAASLKMEPALREKLMDDLSKYFHPDGYARDLLTDGFADAKSLAADTLELLEGE